jgi:hypothetical protein
MNNLDRILYFRAGGEFREFRGITTHIQPANLTRYRALLPQPFGMPELPVVTIFIADYCKMDAWPLTHYGEWSALLKCTLGSEEGWYPVTMPVTSRISMWGGRRMGFPKYVVKEITLATDGDSFKGTARKNDQVQLELRLTPGHTRPLTEWEKALAGIDAFFKGPAFCLSPVGAGPHIFKVVSEDRMPSKWEPRHGMVTVRANPGESWAELLPSEGPYPGTYNHFTGGFNLAPLKMV